MIRPLYDSQFFRLIQGRKKLFDILSRPELVKRSLYKQLRLIAMGDAGEIVLRNRDASGDERPDSVVTRGSPKHHCRAERKTCQPDFGFRIPLIDELDRSMQVGLFAEPVVVFTLTSAGSAEIESKYRKPRALKGARDSKDDLIVHRTSKQRVWMANDSRA